MGTRILPFRWVMCSGFSTRVAPKRVRYRAGEGRFPSSRPWGYTAWTLWAASQSLAPGVRVWPLFTTTGPRVPLSDIRRTSSRVSSSIYSLIPSP